MLGKDTSGPRERALEAGFGDLGDGDLVAIVLGTGNPTQPVSVLAEALLVSSGGLLGLARLGPGGLSEHAGVGLAKALRLGAAIEIGRRIDARRSAPRPKLQSSSQVYEHMAPRIRNLDHEEMWVVALDAHNGARGARRIAVGGLHGCSVSARDILRSALAEAASAIVLVHNHPSGDPTPSAEDIAMTRVVVEAADVVGVPLVDHVIVGAKRHASLLDLGLMG